MVIQREWVTPLAAGSFFLLAVTGVLMFFHVDIGLNKFVHEWLSWVLLAAVGLHVFVNFSGFKRHLAARRGQVLIGLSVIVLGLSFVGGDEGEPPFVAPIRALSTAPLATLAEIAGLSPEALRERLAVAGLQPSSDAQSLADLTGTDVRKQMHALEAVFDKAR